MDDHYDEHETAYDHKKKRHEHHKQPKGILKNSNPNATYHKHHHRRKLDELVENERPEIISTTHTHHGRHKHHHEHHRHHKHEHDEVYNEKNNKMNRRHHSNSNSSKKSGSSRHHKHHKHHSKSDHESNKIDTNDEASEGGVDNHDNIYDSPKVPPIPVVMSNEVNVELTASHEVIDKSEALQIQQEEVVYDVPRSNPRKVEQQKEAIYVNNSFQETTNSEHEQNVTYDVPRSTNIASHEQQQFEELIPVEYDVPKIRDSLSTIEEEHQEYDVPKNILKKATSLDDVDDPIGHNSEENLYENQAYLNDDKNEVIYANDDANHANFSEFSVTTSHTDDRSSGYRSSSSPSIQSEELYVNESAIGSMEDSASNPSPDQALLIPHSKEIGVGTSESLPKAEKKKAKKEKKEKESRREKERAQAEAIDKEILGKKLSLERPKSKAPKPPKTYFTDSSSKKIDLPTVSTSERKKNFLQPFEAHQDNAADNKPEVKKVEVVVNKKPEMENGTIDKKQSQKDRSVDVYHETVRQRATRSTEPVKDMFPEEAITTTTTKRSSSKKKKAPQHPQRDINDEDLPSVKELRSKFESNKSKTDQEILIKKIISSPKKIDFNKKIDFKKGFNVMSSLTRRSAMSVSKSMQNLNVDSSTTTTNNKKENAKKKFDDMEFSHFVVAGDEEREEEEAKVEEEVNNKIESSDPLYVNVEPRKGGSMSTNTKKKEENEDKPLQVQHRARNGAESSTANKLLQSAIADETQEAPDEHQTGLGPWNPMKTVAHLYKLQEIKPGNEQNGNGSDEMEGYLERLPPGKKKSTIWNSWKRQYFVAKAGLLLIFGDSSRSVLMDRIELYGGRVDYMESTMLGIQDRRGHYVVLRFKDAEEADYWHSGLSKHVSHDLAQTFVTPVNPDPSLFKQILVVDFGGSSVRAGIVCSMPTLPQLFFPSVMAIGKGHEDEKYFGLDAFAPEVRSRCNLVHPFAPSSNVDKYTVNQIALQGFLEKIFKDLNIDPSDYEIQLVSPRPLNDRTQKQLAALLFNEFGVKAVNMAHQSILAMYAYNAHSGVVVDLGERMDIIPIVDGYRVSAGVSRSPVGGPQMRQKLQHYLLGKNYSLTTFVDSFVVRTAIESLAYMSRNFDRELERYHRKPEKIDCVLELSKSTKLEMGSERFEAVEGLFKPELWGLDQAGVHVLVHKAIRECSMDVRKEITQSIFLAGGLSMIPGIRERLELELEKLSPATKPRVHGSPYRYHASYLGATVHATSSAFKQTKLTREEWIGASQRLPQPWNLS